MGKFIRNILTGFSVVVISLLMVSCDDEGCIESVVSYAAGSIDNSDAESATVNSFSVWQIGQEKDSAMLTNSTSLSGIEILLNPNDDYTALKFNFNMARDTISDTVTFYYKTRDYFLNIDCGSTTFFDIETILHTGHFITDTEIINPEVTNEKKINFKLYY